jgi:hypothetical protein
MLLLMGISQTQENLVSLWVKPPFSVLCLGFLLPDKRKENTHI